MSDELWKTGLPDRSAADHIMPLTLDALGASLPH
jgi:hypothetical protein